MKLSELQQQLKEVEEYSRFGCGNHGCVINPPKGQGTNSTCRCRPHVFSEILLHLASELSEGGMYVRFTPEKATK